MKVLLITGIIGAILFSCKKEKTYRNFTEKELAFINYTQGQTLKFIDTTSVVQTLVQGNYRREYREHFGLYGRTGAFTEEYEVAYYAQQYDVDLELSVRVYPQIYLTFASYQTYIHNPDSLTYTFPSLTINGKVYNEVYALKMYKDGRPNTNDTATIFHNKEFGVIQLLFPNGKKIVRVD